MHLYCSVSWARVHVCGSMLMLPHPHVLRWLSLCGPPYHVSSSPWWNETLVAVLFWGSCCFLTSYISPITWPLPPGRIGERGQGCPFLTSRTLLPFPVCLLFGSFLIFAIWPGTAPVQLHWRKLQGSRRMGWGPGQGLVSSQLSARAILCESVRKGWFFFF